MNEPQEPTPRRPWGIMTGVVMGAFTTLACVAQGMEPITVLQRVSMAAFLAGAVGSIGFRTMKAIVGPQPNSNETRGSA